MRYIIPVFLMLFSLNSEDSINLNGKKIGKALTKPIIEAYSEARSFMDKDPSRKHLFENFIEKYLFINADKMNLSYKLITTNKIIAEKKEHPESVLVFFPDMVDLFCLENEVHEDSYARLLTLLANTTTNAQTILDDMNIEVDSDTCATVVMRYKISQVHEPSEFNKRHLSVLSDSMVTLVWCVDCYHDDGYAYSIFSCSPIILIDNERKL